MTYIVLEELKDKYKDGFRCIHAEKSKDAYTLHLKNFNTEKIETLETNNLYEISQIQSYLQNMEITAQNAGYDC